MWDLERRELKDGEREMRRWAGGLVEGKETRGQELKMEGPSE